MTASFPEIVEAFAGIQEPLVLDGEILAWNPMSALVSTVRPAVRSPSPRCKRGWGESG